MAGLLAGYAQEGKSADDLSQQCGTTRFMAYSRRPNLASEITREAIFSRTEFAGRAGSLTARPLHATLKPKKHENPAVP